MVCVYTKGLFAKKNNFAAFHASSNVDYHTLNSSCNVQNSKNLVRKLNRLATCNSKRYQASVGSCVYHYHSAVYTDTVITEGLWWSPVVLYSF